MNKDTVFRTVQVAAVALTVAAICRELEKPPEERQWHGRILNVPYDFRFPSLERIMESCWNPYENRVFTPQIFGVGWTINFYSLLERFGVLKKKHGSEEEFLMPGSHMKQVLTQALEVE